MRKWPAKHMDECTHVCAPPKHTRTCTPSEPDVSKRRWKNLPYDLVAIKTLKDGILSARKRI